MQTGKLVILLIITLTVCSCSIYDQQSRKIRSANKRFETKYILLLGCAYELTKGTCVYFWPNHRFSLEYRDSRSSKDYYAGKYVVKTDTVFLSFYKDIKPVGTKDYFLKDSSDKYILIYPSTNGSGSLKFDLKKSSSIL